MMMIPPVEQYSNTFLAQLEFQNAITVTVHSEFFNSEDIFPNGDSLDSANWTEILLFYSDCLHLWNTGLSECRKKLHTSPCSNCKDWYF